MARNHCALFRQRSLKIHNVCLLKSECRQKQRFLLMYWVCFYYFFPTSNFPCHWPIIYKRPRNSSPSIGLAKIWYTRKTGPRCPQAFWKGKKKLVYIGLEFNSRWSEWTAGLKGWQMTSKLIVSVDPWPAWHFVVWLLQVILFQVLC